MTDVNIYQQALIQGGSSAATTFYTSRSTLNITIQSCNVPSIKSSLIGVSLSTCRRIFEQGVVVEDS
jgi:hypothetical protein